MGHERYTCEICDEALLPGNESYDLWVQIVRYREDDDVKTGIEPDKDMIEHDYFVVGKCCEQVVVAAWNNMITGLLAAAREG